MGPRLSFIDTLVLIILVVGGINWGLVSYFNFNLVTALLGSMPVLEKSVYGLVGISGIYTLYIIYKLNRKSII